ncbi:MAG: heme lyase CcmF/NrfE family subunit [Phycisphaerae bacterium]|nr:heme lyase CcmF/NrfE family subunit [Phycisphaerae bacterium]
MVPTGQFALLLAFYLSAYAILADIAGLWRGDSGLIKSGRNATAAVLLCLTAATVALWVVLVRSDFSVIYVAEHTSLNLPLMYKISAFWAGVGGSLLFWLWVQVAFIVVVYCMGARSRGSFAARARAIINLVTVFFLLIMINDRNPFETYPAAVADGFGLNPLLQHPAMALHPPILFVGYAAYMVPFGWAYAWLKTPAGEDTAPMVKAARNWTLAGWLFLTAGIVLGAWWAYEELGWGGYWAWDPVENASLLPWLTSTALLHCFRMYKSRGPVAVWTVVLSILTFSLCVFGRFLTKSGLVSSVHAFPEPGLSLLYIVLLIHLFVIAGVMIGLKYAGRRETIAASPTAHKYIILNNWLLLALTLVILVGTLFPFLTQVFIRIANAVRAEPIAFAPVTLEPSFFTKITAPAGLFLLFLIGACPHLVRRGFTFSWRIVLGVLCAAAAAVVWLATCSLDVPRPEGFSAAMGWWAQRLLSGSPAVPVFILSGYVIVVLVADFVGHKINRAGGKAAAPRSLRWYGARIVHLGVAIMFVGIAGSGGFGEEKALAMRPGDRTTIRDFELTYEKLEGEHGPNFNAAKAVVSITKEGKPVAQLSPAKAVYSPGGKTISEVDIRRTLGGDLYLAMTDVNVSTRMINLRIMVKPLINWIWIGSCIMALGTVMVMVALLKPAAKAASDKSEVFP